MLRGVAAPPQHMATLAQATPLLKESPEIQLLGSERIALGLNP